MIGTKIFLIFSYKETLLSDKFSRTIFLKDTIRWSSHPEQGCWSDSDLLNSNDLMWERIHLSFISYRSVTRRCRLSRFHHGETRFNFNVLKKRSAEIFAMSQVERVLLETKDTVKIFLLHVISKFLYFKIKDIQIPDISIAIDVLYLRHNVYLYVLLK
jgi:hypothetical protein